MRKMYVFLFIFSAAISYAQSPKDSLSELQSLLDSIPDISLEELGIDTTAEIVPDTLHLDIPASIALDTAYARTCLNHAIELIKTGKYDDAYAKADTAKHIYQMNIRYVSKEVADCLHQMARVKQNENELNLSIILNQKALKIRQKVIKQIHTSLANSYNNLGNIYSTQGLYEKAIKYHQKSLKIRLEILGFYHVDVANSYNNLGANYGNIGENEKSINHNENALIIRLKTLEENDLEIATSYNNLGVGYIKLGQYNKAIEYHQRALAIRLKSVEENHPEVAWSYYNLGVSFSLKKKYDIAIKYYKKALEIRLKSFGENHQEVALSYQSLGVYYSEKGEFEKSIGYNEKALAISIKTLGENHPYLAWTYQSLGYLYAMKMDYYNSIKYYNKALKIRIQTLRDNHPDVAYLNSDIGLSYCYIGDFDKAIDFYRKAIEIHVNSLGLFHPYSIHLLNAISKPFYKNYQLDSSLYYLNQAISGIKVQMTSDVSAETKNLYQFQNIPVFESAIEVSLIKSKQDQHDSLKLKTYEYTELAKASLLQSQIKQTDALAFAGIPDFLLQKEYDLRIDINWREKERQGQVEKGKTETDTTVLRVSIIIFDLKREQETLFEILEKDYPEYYRLKYDTKTISLEDTQQKLLQKDQTMLEYFVGDSSIFIFVVRPNTFDVVQVKKDFPLDSLVRQMQSGLYGYYGLAKEQRKDEIFKKSLDDFSEASFNIYQRIIAPVQHLLTSDLVIIPDGVLGYVPFEALLKSKPEKLNQFGTYPYMLNDHTISYNYSATLWNEMKSKKHKKEPSKSLVAFAPFYEGSYTVLDSTINLVFDTLADGRDTTIFQDVVSRKTYAPLPSSGIEAGTVSKMWKGDYFINNDATEQKFYDVAGEYRFVHLSTHGVADARQGDYSYLAFAEQKDSIENEFLYVRDIYNTQLNADLVFLSACETAQGELQRGEGIISLARAFAYAGAKSIITTLWQVDDEATKDISIDFYKNLKKGFTKDVALRQAKLRHIKSAKSTFKHPFFWAAMIGIGDMGVARN